MQLTGFLCRYLTAQGCDHYENCERCHIAGRCEFCRNRYTEECGECGVKDMGKARAILPTRKQKEIIRNAGLIPDNWLVKAETDQQLHIQSKRSGQNKYIKKDRLQTV